MTPDNTSNSTLLGGTVKVSTNTSERYFEQEQQVFRSVWLRVAFEDEVPKPGDYVVKTIDMFGLSIIIARGPDGVVRGFHNVCLHRGNRLVQECKGHARAFVCNFHSWAYNLEGKLTFVMDENDFVALDKSTRGLKPVHTGIWNSVIFVNLAAHPDESLAEFMAPLDPRLGTFDIGALRCAGGYSAEVEANWKTVQDAFMEAYHVRTVHARSLPRLRKHWIPRETSALGHHTTMAAYQQLGDDAKATEAFIWGAASGFMKTDNTTPLPSGLNPDRKPNWVFDQFSVFPNQLFIVGTGWMTHHEFWPLTVDRSRWSASYYVLPTDVPLQEIANEFFKVRVRDTVLEDLHCIEAVHASHRSGVMDDMVISGQEAQILRHRETMERFFNLIGASTVAGEIA